MARAGRVGVGQLVDQQHGGLARQRGIEVELGQRAAAVGDLAQRQGIEPASSAAVSPRPWVSTTPISTSRPALRSRCAALSMAQVLPTPALAPK